MSEVVKESETKVEEEVVVIDGEAVIKEKKQQFVEVDPTLCHYAYAQEVEGVFNDGDVFSFQAYESIPKGHKLEEKLVERCVATANMQLARYREASKESGDLVFDRTGMLAYHPNSVSRLRAVDVVPADGKRVLVDITDGLDLSRNQTFEFNDKTYVVFQDMDLTKNGFGVKFVYGLETVKVDVE